MFSELLVRVIGLLPNRFIKRIGFAQAKSPMVHKVVTMVRHWSKTSDVAIQRGIGAGLKFQAGESNFGYIIGTSEPDTQSAMQAHLKPGDAFWDIGCNVGFLTVIGARLVGSKGSVYSFDPIPNHVELTRHNAEVNKFDHVQVFQNAVASSAGKVKFAVAAIPSQSTLVADGFTKEGATSIEVETVTVDQLVHEKGLRPPNVVKIDVEGAEVEVLRGMCNVLRERRPVIILDTHCTHVECAALLTEAGYWCGTTTDPDKAVDQSQFFCQLLAVPAELKVKVAS
ncbi:MAG: FkbM family methyltransferase [Planctomycetota bacterium]|nr:FkbM family methyltransferase [Planctomycetota bacterium]